MVLNDEGFSAVQSIKYPQISVPVSRAGCGYISRGEACVGKDYGILQEEEKGLGIFDFKIIHFHSLHSLHP